MFDVLSERAIRKRLIRELFWAYLGRDPEPAAARYFLAQLDSGYTAKDIVDQLQASAEFQARFRQAPSAHNPAVVSASADAGSDGEAPPETIQIVVVTTDGLAKVAPQVFRMHERMRPGDLITVFDGSVGPATRLDILVPGQVELVRMPGLSVFHMRARLPSLASQRGWLTILEDHNQNPPDWLDHVHAHVARSSRHTRAFAGAIANRTSTSAWSWANFLTTFSQCWHPVAEGTRVSAGTNVTFARSLLPPTDFRLFEFESDFMAMIHRDAVLDNAAWIDHVQHCGFLRATALQFHNARVAGSCMRMTYPDAGTGLRRGLRHLVIERAAKTFDAIASHPLGKEMPAFTRLRVRWLSAVIAAGYICGSCFGFGRSPWKLE